MESIAKWFPGWEGWGSFWNTFEFGREARAGWIVAFVALFLIASWLYRKDTRALHPFWKVWLWGLRIGVLLALLVVALVPQERKSRSIFEPSRVVILADTSVSMSRQDKDLVAAGGATPQKAVPSRADLVRTLLEKSPLLETLRRTHDVSLVTFDSQLVRQQVLPKISPRNAGEAGAAGPGNSGAGDA
ncbi:MAG: hypothetical protein ACM3U2_21880, partial [Deltaproteobacteria bacterium]